MQVVSQPLLFQPSNPDDDWILSFPHHNAVCSQISRGIQKWLVQQICWQAVLWTSCEQLNRLNTLFFSPLCFLSCSCFSSLASLNALHQCRKAVVWFEFINAVISTQIHYLVNLTIWPHRCWQFFNFSCIYDQICHCFTYMAQQYSSQLHATRD